MRSYDPYNESPIRAPAERRRSRALPSSSRRSFYDETSSVHSSPERAISVGRASITSKPPLTDTCAQTETTAVSQNEDTTGAGNPSLISNLELLASLSAHYMQRLNQSNTLALNRRLRRAFDITDLTHLSNAIIDNILHELSHLPRRFPSPSTAEGQILDPLIETVQSMITEISRQRKTVNEVGAAYVHKMEELGKREAIRSLTSAPGSPMVDMMPSSSPLLHRTGFSAPSLVRRGSSNEDGFLKRTSHLLWYKSHQQPSTPGSRSRSRRDSSVETASRPSSAAESLRPYTIASDIRAQTPPSRRDSCSIS